MKKVVSITIGAVVFNVEEDAYKKLSKYLDDISEYFGKDEDKEEIISDIEISIAEKFTSKKRPANSAITIDDVKKVIDQMGAAKDFKEVADQDPDNQEDENRFDGRKLYRDTDDQIVGGVASGLAAYFGVDTVITRLVFFLSVFVGGFGVILYLVLWVIVKPAKTTGQKLNMRGEKITLKEIEKSVKKGVDNIKKNDGKFVKSVRDFFDKFFKLLGRLVGPFTEFLRIVLGVSFVVAGVSGVCVLSFGMAWILSGAEIPFTQYVLTDFLVLNEYMYALFNFSVYYLVLFPLILFCVGGLSMLKKKFVTSGSLILVLSVVWFASIGFIGSVFMQNAENIEEQVKIIEALSEKNVTVEIDEDGQVRRVEIIAPVPPAQEVRPNY